MLSENISLKKAIYSKSTRYHFKTINFKNLLTSTLYFMWRKIFLWPLLCCVNCERGGKKRTGVRERLQSFILYVLFFAAAKTVLNGALNEILGEKKKRNYHSKGDKADRNVSEQSSYI